MGGHIKSVLSSRFLFSNSPLLSTSRPSPSAIMPISFLGSQSSSRRQRRARIQQRNEERDLFSQAFNRRGWPVARDNRNFPYPQASEVFARAEGSPDDEDFGDLLVNDLVFVGKRVARSKLEKLTMSSYQRALLERGSLHQMEGVEEYNAAIEVSMGYAASVGVCLAEEVATTNGEVGGFLLGV